MTQGEQQLLLERLTDALHQRMVRDLESATNTFGDVVLAVTGER